MRVLRWLVIPALFLIATALGGSIARLVVAIARLPSLVVLVFVAVVLIAGLAAAAKSGAWLANPYW